MLVVFALAAGRTAAAAEPAASPRQEPASTVETLDDLVPRLMVRDRVPGVSIVGIEHHRIAWHREYGV
ncbi:MAG: hypothetical protein JW888_12050, partial [Pirellulales bacterium]|nr:hypothetical protein [Pirellulales bacterium]